MRRQGPFWCALCSTKKSSPSQRTRRQYDRVPVPAKSCNDQSENPLFVTTTPNWLGPAGSNSTDVFSQQSSVDRTINPA